MKNQRRNFNQKPEPVRIRDKRRTIATLKNAARELLVSKGVSGASVQPILDKAGVSRGALFHHFPSKNHLIASAFDELMHTAAIELHVLANELRLGIINLEEFVDGLRAIYCSDIFVGSMEIALNHRVDPTLSELIENTIEKWWVSLSAFWNDTFELPELTSKQAEQHWEMAANLLRGHAFTTLYRSSEAIKADFCTSFQQMILPEIKLRPFKDSFEKLAEDMREAVGYKLFTATAVHPPILIRVYSSEPEICPLNSQMDLETSPWWNQYGKTGQTWRGHDREDLAHILLNYKQFTRLGCGSGISIPVIQDGITIGALNLLDQAHAYSQEMAARAEFFARRAAPLFKAAQF